MRPMPSAENSVGAQRTNEAAEGVAEGDELTVRPPRRSTSTVRRRARRSAGMRPPRKPIATARSRGPSTTVSGCDEVVREEHRRTWSRNDGAATSTRARRPASPPPPIRSIDSRRSMPPTRGGPGTPGPSGCRRRASARAPAMPVRVQHGEEDRDQDRRRRSSRGTSGRLPSMDANCAWKAASVWVRGPLGPRLEQRVDGGDHALRVENPSFTFVIQTPTSCPPALVALRRAAPCASPSR